MVRAKFGNHFSTTMEVIRGVKHTDGCASSCYSRRFQFQPEISILRSKSSKKHSGPRSEGQLGDGGRSSSSTLGLKSILSTLDIASGGNKISDFLTLGLKTHDFDLGHCLRRQKNLDLCDLGSGKRKNDHQICFKCTLNLGPGTLKVRYILGRVR